jgi:DNA-binding CsgD family transcriptional regulator
MSESHFKAVDFSPILMGNLGQKTTDVVRHLVGGHTPQEIAALSGDNIEAVYTLVRAARDRGALKSADRLVAGIWFKGEERIPTALTPIYSEDMTEVLNLSNRLRLREKQLSILAGVMGGYSLSEIAAIQHKSVNTVASHEQVLFGKITELGAKWGVRATRSRAIIFGHRLEIEPLQPETASHQT